MVAASEKLANQIQRANLVRSWLGGHSRTLAAKPSRALRVKLYLFTASQTISQSAATAKNHDDANTERPLPQPVVIT